MPFAVVLTIGVVALLIKSALVMVAPPLIVSDVNALGAPKLKLPVAFSPVPAGVVPAAKSLSFTCASLPVPAGPLFKPVMVTTSSTGVMLSLKVFGDKSVSVPPPLSCT